jgi:hypothetical protein
MRKNVRYHLGSSTLNERTQNNCEERREDGLGFLCILWKVKVIAEFPAQMIWFIEDRYYYVL